MIETRGKVLTTGVLAKFVVGNEGHKFRVLTLLKERKLDSIYYYIGLPNLNTFADLLEMEHSDIGFGGRIQGHVGKEAIISRGGGSLSSEYQLDEGEKEATFSLIQVMMRELGGNLSWDQNPGF